MRVYHIDKKIKTYQVGNSARLCRPMHCLFTKNLTHTSALSIVCRAPQNRVSQKKHIPEHNTFLYVVAGVMVQHTITSCLVARFLTSVHLDGEGNAPMSTTLTEEVTIAVGTSSRPVDGNESSPTLPPPEALSPRALSI